MCFLTDDDAGYTADSIHPNERGYEPWASHIVSAIAAEACRVRRRRLVRVLANLI